MIRCEPTQQSLTCEDAHEPILLRMQRVLLPDFKWKGIYSYAAIAACEAAIDMQSLLTI